MMKNLTKREKKSLIKQLYLDEGVEVDVVDNTEFAVIEAYAKRMLDQIKKEEPLEKARQQFTGFAHAKDSDDITGLCSSMGLQSNEWEAIREDVKEWISHSEFEEAEEYFEDQNINPLTPL